ncbi:PIN domain-containing protein [Akkermansiaceae bacterium]|nr:PIN domain-containing protein [Akkermansiaceae bacterium]
MVLVDSSAWIEGFRQKGRIEVKSALEGLLGEQKALWCSPVRLEVLGGARKTERQKLAGHFQSLPYRRCTEEDWDRSVALSWKLRGEGLNLPWMDILIASIAIHDRLRIFTLDKHFEQIAHFVPLHLYTPGYGGSYREEQSL